LNNFSMNKRATPMSSSRVPDPRIGPPLDRDTAAKDLAQARRNMAAAEVALADASLLVTIAKRVRETLMRGSPKPSPGSPPERPQAAQEPGAV
jgi:hypothetical protein